MKTTFIVLVLVLVMELIGVEAHDALWAQNVPLRSAEHPAATAPSRTTTGSPWLIQPPYAPTSLVFQSAEWSLMSRSVNYITCHAQQGDELWLGTQMGVKLVDRRRKTVRHFTRLEGLPSDFVVALAAEQDAAWCLTQTAKSGKFFVALCRFDRKREQWETLREVPRPFPKTSMPTYYTVGIELDNNDIIIAPDYICIATSPVPRSADIMFYLFDKRQRRWSEVAWDPNLRADYPFLNVTLLDADRDNVWLGTNAGLLRYRVRERQWQRFLPDRMIWAGASEDSAFWLANSLRAVPSSPMPLTDRGWLLTRFALKTSETQDYVRPTQSGSGSYYRPGAGLPTGVSVADGGIWATTWGSESGSARAGFHFLNLKTEQWRVYTPQNAQDMEFVPDAALRHPTIPRSTLLVTYAQHRFPDWFCAEEKLPVSVSLSTSAERYTARIEEQEGSVVWTVQDNNVLVRAERESQRVERFPLTASTALTPPVHALALLGDRLFALMSDGIQSLDLRSGNWRKVSLPLSSGSSLDTYSIRLLAEGDDLWVGNDRMALRHDPKSDQFSVAADYAGKYLRLFGISEDSLWLIDASSHPLRADLKGGPLEQVEFLLPFEVQPRLNARPQPMAVVGNIFWFTLNVQPTGGASNALIGYDVKAKEWIAPLYLRSSTFRPRSILRAGDTVFVAATYEEAGSVQSYNVKTRRWEAVTTRLPIESGSFSPLILISVDNASIWGMDAERMVLWEFDRKAKTWTAHHNPGRQTYQSATDVAVRWGDVIFVASREGLWRFSVSQREWQRVPILTLDGLNLSYLVNDEKAVWAMCSQSRSSQYYAARFDRTTKQWMIYGEESGFPERMSPSRLIVDGETAWVFAANEVYRLNPKTNRWQNLSRELSDDAKVRVIVRSLVPDGQYVWMLTSGVSLTSSLGANEKMPRVSPLVRYDKTSGAFTQFDPELTATHNGRSLLVERDAVYVATSLGFYRFDKAAQTWSKVEPPLPFPAGSASFADRIVRANGALWFMSGGGVIRWSGK